MGAEASVALGPNEEIQKETVNKLVSQLEEKFLQVTRDVSNEQLGGQSVSLDKVLELALVEFGTKHMKAFKDAGKEMEKISLKAWKHKPPIEPEKEKQQVASKRPDVEEAQQTAQAASMQTFSFEPLDHATQESSTNSTQPIIERRNSASQRRGSRANSINHKGDHATQESSTNSTQPIIERRNSASQRRGSRANSINHKGDRKFSDLGGRELIHQRSNSTGSLMQSRSGMSQSSTRRRTTHNVSRQTGKKRHSFLSNKTRGKVPLKNTPSQLGLSTHSRPKTKALELMGDKLLEDCVKDMVTDDMTRTPKTYKITGDRRLLPEKLAFQLGDEMDQEQVKEMLRAQARELKEREKNYKRMLKDVLQARPTAEQKQYESRPGDNHKKIMQLQGECQLLPKKLQDVFGDESSTPKAKVSTPLRALSQLSRSMTMGNLFTNVKSPKPNSPPNSP